MNIKYLLAIGLIGVTACDSGTTLTRDTAVVEVPEVVVPVDVDPVVQPDLESAPSSLDQVSNINYTGGNSLEILSSGELNYNGVTTSYQYQVTSTGYRLILDRTFVNESASTGVLLVMSRDANSTLTSIVKPFFDANTSVDLLVPETQLSAEEAVELRKIVDGVFESKVAFYNRNGEMRYALSTIITGVNGVSGVTSNDFSRVRSLSFERSDSGLGYRIAISFTIGQSQGLLENASTEFVAREPEN